jgi:hypothetical protein
MSEGRKVVVLADFETMGFSTRTTTFRDEVPNPVSDSDILFQ